MAARIGSLRLRAGANKSPHSFAPCGISAIAEVKQCGGANVCQRVFAGNPVTKIRETTTKEDPGRMEAGTSLLHERVRQEAAQLLRVREEVGRVIVGQRYLIDRLLIGLLANGHVLLEGVPGLAKTLSVKTLARTIDASFQRIQFTPDLLPADLIGTLVYQPQNGTFVTKKGPIFAHLVLADEINRAPAKVQSALLEAMQERQVTIGEETHTLPDPFLVLATQNPIEQEGTYPLPEAQVDRFMLKLSVPYPSKAEERQILDRMASTLPPPEPTPVLTTADIVRLRQVVDQVYIDDKIKDYIVDLVFATREPQSYRLDLQRWIQYGASPRATLYLTLAAKAHALLQGRGYVTPQDVKSIAPDVLRHRVIVSYEAEAEDITSDIVVQRVLDGVPVP
jgi:MoxR-like ATPase